MSLLIRSAEETDLPQIMAFIRALAEYEKLAHLAVASHADLEAALFSQSPKVFCDLAEWDGKPTGFALWFYSFSTFRGRHGVWLEDLFVDPALRGKGIGKALLANLANRCVEEKLGRLEWSVLDWNTPSIGFYKALGAVLQDEWTTCRLDGDALVALST